MRRTVQRTACRAHRNYPQTAVSSHTPATLLRSPTGLLANSNVKALSSAKRVSVSQFSTTARARLAEVVDHTPEPAEEEEIEHAQDQVDVCIVGGGPAGLCAAIKIKQLAAEKGKEVRVVLLEKGGEIGQKHLMLQPHRLIIPQALIFSLEQSSNLELWMN